MHHVAGMSEAAMAEKLSMSRNAVARLALAQPHAHKPARSQRDGFVEQIAAMLTDDPTVPATVPRSHYDRRPMAGSAPVVKDHVRQVRPSLTAARSFQRTSSAGRAGAAGLVAHRRAGSGRAGADAGGFVFG